MGSGGLVVDMGWGLVVEGLVWAAMVVEGEVGTDAGDESRLLPLRQWRILTTARHFPLTISSIAGLRTMAQSP